MTGVVSHTDIAVAEAFGPYDVILSDPPWDYYGSATKWGAAAKFYPLMKDEEIAALPMPRLLSPKGVLFLWATSSTIDRCIGLINAWGLTYRGMAFVWVKTAKNGKPFGARGVRPSITKPLTEFVLAASRVKKGRPMKVADESVVQTVFAPLGEHSAKPTEVHRRIERLYPGCKRLEMFARRVEPGWMAWGNEVPNCA